MRYVLITLLSMLLFSSSAFAQETQDDTVNTIVPPCKKEAEIRNLHIIRYRAIDGSPRGCLVPAYFFTQIKKQRARLTGAKKIQICEGNYRYSPREGNSFAICPYKR